MHSISGLDYSTSRCQSIDIDDVKRKDHLKDVAGVNYFEKICLRRNQSRVNGQICRGVNDFYFIQ